MKLRKFQTFLLVVFIAHYFNSLNGEFSIELHKEYQVQVGPKQSRDFQLDLKNFTYIQENPIQLIFTSIEPPSLLFKVVALNVNGSNDLECDILDKKICFIGSQNLRNDSDYIIRFNSEIEQNLTFRIEYVNINDAENGLELGKDSLILLKDQLLHDLRFLPSSEFDSSQKFDLFLSVESYFLEAFIKEQIQLDLVDKVFLVYNQLEYQQKDGAFSFLFLQNITLSEASKIKIRCIKQSDFSFFYLRSYFQPIQKENQSVRKFSLGNSFIDSTFLTKNFSLGLNNQNPKTFSRQIIFQIQAFQGQGELRVQENKKTHFYSNLTETYLITLEERDLNSSQNLLPIQVKCNGNNACIFKIQIHLNLIKNDQIVVPFDGIKNKDQIEQGGWSLIFIIVVCCVIFIIVGLSWLYRLIISNNEQNTQNLQLEVLSDSDRNKVIDEQAKQNQEQNQQEFQNDKNNNNNQDLEEGITEQNGSQKAYSQEKQELFNNEQKKSMSHADTPQFKKEVKYFSDKNKFKLNSKLSIQIDKSNFEQENQ